MGKVDMDKALAPDFRESPLYQRIGEVLRSSYEYGYAMAKDDSLDRGTPLCSHEQADSAGRNRAIGDATLMLFHALGTLSPDERMRILTERVIPDWVVPSHRVPATSFEEGVRLESAKQFMRRATKGRI